MSLYTSSHASTIRTERATERRAKHGVWLTAQALKQRADDAARSIMRGLPPEDRADCAAAILAKAIAKMPQANGARRDAKSRRNPNVSPYRRAVAAEQRELAPPMLPVLASDPLYSFTALKHLAEHFRRDLLKRREREAAHDHAMMDRERAALRQSGRSLVAHVQDREDERRSTVPDEVARELADSGAWQLSKVPHSAVDGRAYANVWALLYSETRGAPAPVVANDLGCEVSALWQRQSRGRSALKSRHPRARDLLLALLGTEPDDDSLPAAHASGATMATEWRSRLAEVAPVAIRRDPQSDANSRRRAKRRRAKMTDEMRAASLTRLARAQYLAMQSTLPTKPLATKSGHAGETGLKH